MPKEDEAQAPSLLETMEAAYDEMETAETAETIDTKAVIPNPDDAEDTVEAAAEGEDDETETDDQSETDETDDSQPLTAPKHWSDEDKKVFDAMDAGGQEFLLRRHREMEADYTRKTQEVAEQRKAIEPLEKVLAPYRSSWSAHGVSDAQAVERLLGAHVAMINNPTQTIQYLAKTYGADLSELAPGDTQSDYTDPETKALRDEINELRGFIQQQSMQQQTAQAGTVQAQIDSFSSATDSDGQLLHPHFSAVQNRMAVLINAERQLGNEITLEDAYNASVKLDPKIQELIEKDMKKKAEKQLEEQAAARAKKARRAAATNIRSSGNANGNTVTPKDTRSELEQAWDQLGGT